MEEREVLERIEARRKRASRRLLDKRITLAHGAGGRSTQALIEALLLPALRNPLLEPLGDSAVLSLDGGERLAFSTDSYVVKPPTFPGGDIAKLAVHGTINDLAVSGAKPLALSVALILEEGLEVAELERYIASLAQAASAAGVPIATGDTKVVERGKADSLYITSSGVGLLPLGLRLGPSEIRAGDRVLLSGTIADHGMAVLVARGELELEGAIESDTAPLHELVATLLDACGGSVRCMRDPTRGGLATTLNEFARDARCAIVIEESALPLRPIVGGACEILGIDPLYVANEGKLVAIVAPHASEAALAALRSHPLGVEAAVIGEVSPAPSGMVILDTTLGGSRVVDTLAGDPLPRIC
ncbi:MAG: hydrogenase expression/formation protein HypE [Solirubrobacteraceae bacterium]|jgi:hydrogenase expression/formation protein HypE